MNVWGTSKLEFDSLESRSSRRLILNQGLPSGRGWQPFFFHSEAYIGSMLWRGPRGRPLSAPAAFIPPCQPIVAKQPPTGPGWAHELKHDGYRLQIHVRNGRVRLYTMNGNDWTKRYPRIVEEAARLREPLIIDAEVVHLSAKGVADFDALHSRTADEKAVALAFDLLVSGDDIRRKPLFERKATLKWVLRERAVAFSTSTIPRATERNCLPPFAISALKEL